MIVLYDMESYSLQRLQAISKNGFWFKIATDSGFKPQAYACMLRI